MKKSVSKGFTLIELLVVIAIIGILAGIRSQAEILFDSAGDYDGVCTNTTIAAQLAAAESAGGGTAVCNEATTPAGAWAASAPLKTAADGHWCVDSTGASRGIAAALVAQTVCPAA